MIENSREAKDIGRFIRARREKTDASNFSEIPKRRRHVPHLTQSDLAELIDVSTVVISHIEQGRYPNLNLAILHRISHTLRLSQQQETYLLGLFEFRTKEQKVSQPAPAWVETSIKQVTHPILVQDPAYGLLCLNKSAQWMFGNLDPGLEPNTNLARFVFENPKVRGFIADWRVYAATVVSGMKMYYAMYPEYRSYIDHIADELQATDSDFRDLWQQNDPLVKPTLEKKFIHADVGEINIRQILTDIVEAPGLTRIDLIPADDTTRRIFDHV